MWGRARRDARGRRARREREGDGVVERSRGYEMMMDDTCYVGWSFTSRA